MNFMNFLSSIRRRWYIGVAGLLITAVACVFVYQTVKPTYERSASELLLPGSSSIPKDSNPYLFLGDVSQATDILVRALTADDVQSPALNGREGASVAVSRDVSTSGPIVVMTVTAKTDADTKAVLHKMLDQLELTLATLQTDAGAKGNALITSTQLTFDENSTLVQKTRYTYTGGVGAGGLVVTILTIALVDGLILGRVRRRRAEAKTVLVALPEALDGNSEDDENSEKSDGKGRGRQRPSGATARANG
jgi:hypothetical protein